MLQGVFASCVGKWAGLMVLVEEILDAGDAIVVLGRYGRYCGIYKATGRA